MRTTCASAGGIAERNSISPVIFLEVKGKNAELLEILLLCPMTFRAGARPHISLKRMFSCLSTVLPSSAIRLLRKQLLLRFLAPQLDKSRQRHWMPRAHPYPQEHSSPGIAQAAASNHPLGAPLEQNSQRLRVRPFVNVPMAHRPCRSELPRNAPSRTFHHRDPWPQSRHRCKEPMYLRAQA